MSLALLIPLPSAFDVMTAAVNSSNTYITVVNVYRPPKLSLGDSQALPKALEFYVDVGVTENFKIHVDIIITMF